MHTEGCINCSERSLAQNRLCCDGHCCCGNCGDSVDDGRLRTACWIGDSIYQSSGSSSSSSNESSSTEHSGCTHSIPGNFPNGNNFSKTNPACVVSHSLCSVCCSGDCHGCCHGDCGRYGHFGCHDDSGRSGGYFNFGKMSSGAGGDSGSTLWESGCDDGTYLATKLRVQTQLLREALECQDSFDKKLQLYKLKDTILPWIELVDKAIIKLDHQDVLQDELHASKKLFQLQKARHMSLMGSYVTIETQLKEVNEDYGQLLVEHAAQEKMIEGKLNRVFHDSFTQTESLTMVDVGTVSCPTNKSVNVQTKACIKVAIQTNMSVCVGEERDQSSQSCTVVPNAGNGCEPPQGQRSDAVAHVGNSAEATTAARCNDPEIASTGETQRLSHLPNERTPRNERPVQSGGAVPLLRDQTKEHTGEQNSEGTSVPSITWPCNHYKRLCLVKFECCDMFYPCHRCHNDNAVCGERAKKAKDANLLKCLCCNEVQKITEDSRHCCKCGEEFAKYFCSLCQQFTGMDEKPYHCLKCGICRVNGDISFHCDSCGVCLDNQLRDNHACREGSAHDPCCICFEDAFTGCQILPCSHKVHKNCATMMIRNGVSNCPVCRESFVCKLKREPNTGMQ